MRQVALIGAGGCVLSQKGRAKVCEKGSSRLMIMAQNALSFVLGTVAPLAIVIWVILQ
jgi:hypothetical protein